MTETVKDVACHLRKHRYSLWRQQLLPVNVQSLSSWSDRKVLIKLLSFLSLLLFRDEILSNNAAIYTRVYMQLFHCCYARIIRTRALQMSLFA